MEVLRTTAALTLPASTSLTGLGFYMPSILSSNIPIIPSMNMEKIETPTCKISYASRDIPGNSLLNLLVGNPLDDLETTNGEMAESNNSKVIVL